MTELLQRDYDMTPTDLPRFVYAQTTHADDIARVGKLVIDAAENGDALAARDRRHAPAASWPRPCSPWRSGSD